MPASPAERVGASPACPARARSASGPGCTVTPSAASARRCSPGHVLVVEGDAVAAARRRPRSASRSVRAPRRTSARRARRGRRATAASTRSDWPSAIAAWWVIRASWPAADHADDGEAVRSRCAASTVYGSTARRARGPGTGCRSGTMDGVSRCRTGAGRRSRSPIALWRSSHRELVKFAIVGRHHLGDRHRRLPRAQEHRAGAQADHREDHRRARGDDRVVRPQPRVVLPHPRRPRAPPRGRCCSS